MKKILFVLLLLTLYGVVVFSPSFGICTPEGVNTRICNPKNNFPFVLVYNLQLNLSNHYHILIL